MNCEELHTTPRNMKESIGMGKRKVEPRETLEFARTMAYLM
jgi:hypothetical protein